MSASTFKKLSAIAVTAALAMAGLSVAHAGPIPPYKTGFEVSPNTSTTANPFQDNPAVSYLTGPLAGQNHWQDLNSTANTNVVLTSSITPAPPAAEGSQAVKMTANGNYTDYYTTDTNFSGAQVASSFGNQVQVVFDMSRAVPTGTRSTGFGVEILSKNQDQVLGSVFLGNDTTAAHLPQLLATAQGDNNVPNHAGGFGRNDGSWGTYSILLDFNKGTFTVYVEGNTGAAGPFAMSALGLAEGNDIGAIALSSTGEGNDVAYFDNLRVVPEPAGIAMVGIGSLLLLAKRPKRLA